MVVYCITKLVSLCIKYEAITVHIRMGHASHLGRGSIKGFKAHFVSVNLCLEFEFVKTENEK